MCRKLFLLISFALLVTFGVTTLALGAPLPSGSLKVGTVIDIGNDLGYRSSMYNPRSLAEKNYIVQINNKGFGCYPVDSAVYEALCSNEDGFGTRMAGPFPAADYVLAAGDSGNDLFSRFDPNLSLDTRVFATNLDVRPSSYDWVDGNTIIHNSYKSGLRSNLYLTDINPDPFQVTANTSWNANGYVTTEATTRIRNVRMGDIYNGYAYYGDAGTENAGFWAIDLATGVSIQLGTLSVTGSGSWGLWTVKEVDGFLYVHTTHDGIYIYNMTDATTLGTLHTRYTKDKLDALAEDTNPNWGFDVVDDGRRMLLSAGLGRVIEIIDSRIAGAPDPASGATDVNQAPILKWSPGDQALSHQVYFGTDEEAVRIANIGSPEYKGSRDLGFESYDPGQLQWDTTYYWRVDEVNDANPESPWVGGIWSFTTANFLVVDDFEDYNDYPPDEIFSTWIDGYEVATNGALVGYSEPDFAQGEHYVETTIVHGGAQSMPYFYDNTGTANYSEAERTFSPAQDWTREGVKVLSLWFKGYPAYMGSFVEGPTGTYTMNAEGADIWNKSDQFHFAYKELSGAGTIIAKVESVENTHEWAKAGVMIRDTLEPDSRHAMVAVTPGNGVWFGRRETAGGSSSSDNEAGITAPQWVKLERTIGGLAKAYYSPDGTTWTQLGAPESVTMNTPVYIGLAVTSHNSGIVCEAKFSNVSFPDTTVGPQWTNQDIGITSNDAEPIYVTVKDGSGTAAMVYHDDPSAAQIAIWTEWNIDLKEFGDAGVVLTDVNNLSIGFGVANDPQDGGSGLVFFDDIRLYRPSADTSLVIYYSFDDVGEIVADQSGKGHDGIVFGNVTAEANGKYGGAANFASTGNSYLDLDGPGFPAEDIPTSAMTLAAWIKCENTGLDHEIFNARASDESWLIHPEPKSSGDIRWLLRSYGGTTIFQIRAGTVTWDQWLHFAGTYDKESGKAALYINGELIEEMDVASPADIAGDWDLGARVGLTIDNARPFTGLMDEFRMYTRALSHDEILAIMQGP